MAKATPAKPRKAPAKAKTPPAGTSTPPKPASSKNWRVVATTPEEVAQAIDASLAGKLDAVAQRKGMRKTAKVYNDAKQITESTKKSPKNASQEKNNVKSVDKSHGNAADVPLNAKQQRFVDEYLVDLNATQAALRAGYSEKTARIIACENLSKPNIAKAIQAARDKTANRLEITRERVMAEYARLAFVDPRAFYHQDGSLKSVPELDQDTAAALVGFEVDVLFDGTGGEAVPIGTTKKVKWSDKKAALDSINRMMGWNQDKLKLQGDPEAPIEVRTKVVMVPPKQVAEVISRPVNPEAG